MRRQAATAAQRLGDVGSDLLRLLPYDVRRESEDQPAVEELLATEEP